MPPTLVNVAFGVLLGTALLGAAYDRRSIAFVALLAILPNADAFMSLLVQGASNAVLHSIWLPLVVGGLLLWDTTLRQWLANRPELVDRFTLGRLSTADLRERSWLLEQYGWRGARIAWVGLASFAVAGIGVDLFSETGVNLLYPVHDQFYAIDGKFVISTTDGVEQTYVGLGDGHLLDVDRFGTTAEYHVSSVVNPGADDPRQFSIVESGWQLIVVCTAPVLLAVRAMEGR